MTEALTKYLVLSYNEVDEEWSHYGMKDTFDEAVTLAYHADWPDNPPILEFRPRFDVLDNTWSAWSGHDQWFIFPVANVRA